MTQINLGDVARDKITGFKGMVVARTKWLQNCDRLMLQPQELDKDGKVADSQSFDEPFMEFIKHTDLCECAKPETVKTGGPRPEPSRR